MSAAEVTTASRMSSAIQVLRVCGALPATFCHSPTSGLSASFSTERAVTRHISPGRAGALRSSLVVWAAMTSMLSSTSRSRTDFCSSVEMDTMYRSWGAWPKRGLAHSVRTPDSVAR